MPWASNVAPVPALFDADGRPVTNAMDAHKFSPLLSTLAGLGSVYFLLYNGLVLGTVFGHLSASGQGDNLLQFTSGHAALTFFSQPIASFGWSLTRDS